MKWRFSVFFLLAALMNGCAGVEYHHSRVNKDTWLASKYLEAGKEPPQELVLQAKVVNPVVWLAVIEALFKFLPDFLKYQGSMRHETDIRLLFWWPLKPAVAASKQDVEEAKEKIIMGGR